MGCGPNWNGTFIGTVSQEGTCSDGSSAQDIESAVKVTLRDEGDTVTWEGSCGSTFIADISGDSAILRESTCPSTTLNDGTTRSTTVEGGTLDLNDNVLRMELDFFITLSGTITATCSLTAEGSLNRLEE